MNETFRDILLTVEVIANPIPFLLIFKMLINFFGIEIH